MSLPHPDCFPDLSALGWDERHAAAFAPYAARRWTPARVARAERGACDVLGPGGLTRAGAGGGLLAATAGDPAAAPAVGDWVAIQRWPDGRLTVEAVVPRRTAMLRATASGRSTTQVLAANVDVVVIVVSLAIEPDLARLERFLALAWDGGARPLIALTKADLVSDAPVIAAEVAEVAPGADVLCVSGVSGEGVDGLRSYADGGRTLALVGPSGAGKSTLANALLGSDLLATGDTRRDGKGRHTTTWRELVALPAGGVLIDTPGLRGLGVTDAAAGLRVAFADIEELGAHCRFADCAHDSEPGCAVTGAVAAGDLAERRLLSWRKLQREAAWVASRTDARLRAEQRRRWKQVHLDVRRSGTIRR